MLTQIEKKQRYQIKKVYQLFLMCLILCGSNYKIASCESNEYLKNTAVKNLHESDPVLREIIYQPGSFLSFYDEVTQIGHTSCYFPKEKTEDFPENNNLSNPSSPILGGQVCKMDGRELVDGTQWPYSAHGHMTMKFPKAGNRTGSGVMVGPHHVLTAAHNLYFNGEWATEVLFSSARNKEDRSFGENKGCVLLVSNEWYAPNKKENTANKNDFGMVILDTCIGAYTGWLGLFSAPDILLQDWNVSVTGYPADKGVGENVATQMWTMRNSISCVEPDLLYYPINTYQGESGGAAWGEWPGFSGYYAAGVHVRGEEKVGKGQIATRLSKSKFFQIVNWIKQYQLPSVKYDSTHIDQASPNVEFVKELLSCTDGCFESLIQRAINGEANALYQVGKMYLKGEGGIPKDDMKAFACFRKTAECGHKDGLAVLGECYETGRGTEKNLSKAISLYNQAINKNNFDSVALRLLGLCYLERGDVPKNPNRAIELLKKSAKLEDKDSAYHLGCIYENGHIVHHDKVLAAKYYGTAEELGYKLPQSVFSLMSRPSKQEVIEEIHQKIFRAYLKGLNTFFENPLYSSKTIFICYSDEDKSHQFQVKNLAHDLVRSGASENNIYYDKWTNKPGCGYTKNQYNDSIFKTDKVIFIGSQSLKYQYESGLGFTTQAIENLKTRITKKGVQGIIPVWFEEIREGNFPLSFENLRGKYLGQDYCLNFFDLLINLYDLNIIDNPIKAKKKEFKKKRVVPDDSIVDQYGKKISETKQRQKEQDELSIKNILGL